MGRAKITLNNAGIAALLRSSEVSDELERRGKAMADAAGPGHSVRRFQGRDRVRVHVATESPEAMEAEATDRTLTRAIDAGR